MTECTLDKALRQTVSSPDCMGLLGIEDQIQLEQGQDVSGVLDSTAVDTSILEQYLSNEIDPTFMLPDSPPDSGSEPCSPPQILDDINPTLNANHTGQNPFAGHAPINFCQLNDGPQEHYDAPPPALYDNNGTINYMNSRLSAISEIVRESPLHSQYISPVDNYIPASPCYLPSLPTTPLGASGDYTKTAPFITSPCLQPHAACLDTYMSSKPCLTSRDIFPERKKRRCSNSFDGNTDESEPEERIRTNTLFGLEGGTGEMQSDDVDANGGSPVVGPYRQLLWGQYQPKEWRTLYNISFQSLLPPGYHVETDKGFSYSPADEAFVCQKKNHFQITVHIGMVGDPKYVKTPSDPMPIDSFHVKVFGVKFEAQSHQITIEQSQTDRTKKPFLPVQVDLPGNKITKITLGRLHFNETTANNMRKKGKPNPEQRYFLLVVGLYAIVNQKSYLLVANISERIIVRASNPGQFENDSEVLWQKGQTSDSVVYQGWVGINTDAPDEALVVCGNAKIMGTVLHPSDRRAKENIHEVDSTEQLKRIAQMRIVEYDYKPEFASKMGINQTHETGIIAQELKELLPTAVRDIGDVNCLDGQNIPNFLMVDKEQIFMENVGAVKQLCKLTDNLETRIQELEVWNARLAKLKNLGSVRSKNTASIKRNYIPSTWERTSATASNTSTRFKTQFKPREHKVVDESTTRESKKSHAFVSPEKSSSVESCKDFLNDKYQYCLQHRLFQATIILLVAVMALCAICITTLYMLTLREDPDLDVGSSTSNSSVFPVYTTTQSLTTDFTTSSPGPWPPDIDFSSVFYSEEVYCCHHAAPSIQTPVTSSDFLQTPSYKKQSPSDYTQQKLFHPFPDWTNTTIQSIHITQNQQAIDDYYLDWSMSRKGNYTYSIPISKHIPINMPVTLQMTATELLVVHLCGYELRKECSALMDYNSFKFLAVPNTQGYIHEWPLSVARHFTSSYHFRVTVAGQADCSTDPNYLEVLFTDYYFNFFRRCL